MEGGSGGRWEVWRACDIGDGNVAGKGRVEREKEALVSEKEIRLETHLRR